MRHSIAPARNTPRPTSRWVALAALAVFLVCSRTCVEATSASTSSKRPVNLVLISIDTLRQDELSCYGNPRLTSPVLDALAKRGRRFTNAFAVSSLTAPSHMSIFTSQYPFEHGVGYDREGLRPGSAYTDRKSTRLNSSH